MPRYVDLPRARLVEMLAAGDSPASAECLRAVRRGAPYQVHPDTVARESALRIYALRAQLTQADGTPTVGMDEALRDLANSSDPRVRIVAVSGEHDFALFLDPDATRVISCLGVVAPAARSAPGGVPSGVAPPAGMPAGARVEPAPATWLRPVIPG